MLPKRLEHSPMTVAFGAAAQAWTLLCLSAAFSLIFTDTVAPRAVHWGIAAMAIAAVALQKGEPTLRAWCSRLSPAGAIMTAAIFIGVVLPVLARPLAAESWGHVGALALWFTFVASRCSRDELARAGAAFAVTAAVTLLAMEMAIVFWEASASALEEPIRLGTEYALVCLPFCVWDIPRGGWRLASSAFTGSIVLWEIFAHRQVELCCVAIVLGMTVAILHEAPTHAKATRGLIITLALVALLPLTAGILAEAMPDTTPPLPRGDGTIIPVLPELRWLGSGGDFSDAPWFMARGGLLSVARADGLPVAFLLVCATGVGLFAALRQPRGAFRANDLASMGAELTAALATLMLGKMFLPFSPTGLLLLAAWTLHLQPDAPLALGLTQNLADGLRPARATSRKQGTIA